MGPGWGEAAVVGDSCGLREAVRGARWRGYRGSELTGVSAMVERALILMQAYMGRGHMASLVKKGSNVKHISAGLLLSRH